MAGSIASDVVVTEFDLRGSNAYVSKSQSIIGATNAIHAAQAKAQGATHSLSSTIGAFGDKVVDAGQSVVDFTGKIVRYGAAAAAITVGVGAMGFGAMKAAAAFDTMERTFGGAMGNMAAGKEMMAALEVYANKSAFSLDALSRAAAMLAAGGLSVKTYLPVMERFALVISGVDPQGLEQVAGALMRAKGGAFGEAMEAFRRAGVGSQDFRNQGIAINKGGEVQSTPEQFLKSIIKISEGRLKDIADAISGGDETKISNAGDVLAQTYRQIGKVLNEAFLPSVVGATDELQLLVKSGVVKDIAQGFTDLISSVTGDGGIVGAVDSSVVALGTMPKALKVFGDGLNTVGKAMWMLTTPGLAKAAFDASPVGALIGDKLTKKLNKLIFGQEEGFGKAVADVSGWTETDLEVQSRKEARRLKDRRNGANEIPWPSIDTGKNPLDVIATNTGKTAENTQKQLDIQRSILGGGTVGAGAVSPVNLSKAFGAVGGGRHPKLDRAVALIAEAVNEAIGQQWATAARQSPGFGGRR